MRHRRRGVHVLLAAHGRGLAGYWRTPGVLRTPDGAAAVGMGEDELFVALIHLGRARGEKKPPERLPPGRLRNVPPVIPRADALAALERDDFDVVVIGGGITGAGVALDAASRGYSVALVEKADYASGTSSRSSKLVHGGLRYLQNFDLGLVREALLERQLMVNLAPHLVKPLPLLIPAFEGKRADRITRDGPQRLRRDGAGAPAPAATTSGAQSAIARSTPRRPSALLPALAAREPTCAYLFYDCQTDDVRLVLTVLGEAERFGAVCCNGVEVSGLVERDGRAAGCSAATPSTAGSSS